MNLKETLLALALVGMSFAAPLTIPTDQPICNMYGQLKTFGTIVGILVAAYGGFVLSSTHETTERNQAKTLLGGVAIGLIIIWLSPLVVTNLVGASSVCGWS